MSILAYPSVPDAVDWSQPVNWDNPLNQGLVSWWLAVPNAMGWGSNTWRDLCHRNNGTLTGMDPKTDWVGSSHPGGWGALNFNDAGSDYCVIPTSITTYLGSGYPFTISCWVKAANTNTQYGRFIEKGANTEWVLNLNQNTSDSGQISFMVNSTDVVITSTTTCDNVWRHICGVSPGAGGTAKLFVNGVEEASGTLDTAQPGTGDINIGRYGGGGYGALFQGDDFRFMLRACANSEVFALYHESLLGYPNLLNRISTRTWFVPAGITAYTLACSGGVYALTGAAPTLTAARNLTTTGGSFTETGGTAGLAFGRNLATTGGSYTLTGNTAGLTATRQLATTGGSFTETGGSAGLAAGRKLATTGGSFTETGGTAGLAAQRELATTGGVFTFTGADATLNYNNAYELATDGGSFTLSGSSPSLVVTRELATTGGSFTVTGATATLTYTPVGSYTLATDGAVYTFTGNTAGLTATRQLTTAGGTFAETGGSASFAATRTLATTGGSFTETGGSAGVTAQRKLSAAGAVFTETGGTITLVRNYPLSTTGGTFSVTGATVPLTFDHFLTATGGSFIITGATVTLTYSGETNIDINNPLYNPIFFSRIVGLSQWYE